VTGLGASVQVAYLARLGVDPEAPSAEALRRLHGRHAERIPYETMWIHAGERWTTDALAAAERIALHARGGYCFHLNGAFAELLEALGYQVTRHVGGVHGPAGPTDDEVGNHLVLTVSDLPDDTNPGGEWYVDVGLGDALHDPIPLVPGVTEQGPFGLELERVHDAIGDWHLIHDPAGGFAGMRWSSGIAKPSDFTAQHEYLSTSPESGFVRIALAQTRDATGVDVMYGLILKRIGSNASVSEPMTTRSEWFDALGDLFGLRFESSTPEAIDALWARTLQRHRDWDAAGRP
jgi:N-hydroxyarylamine O-acetyltransferase